MKDCEDKVIDILKEDAMTRDSDEILYSRYIEKLGYPATTVTVSRLLTLITLRAVPTFETISRCRRLAQTQHSELRGDSWEKRHFKAEKIKKELIDEKA